MTARPRDFASLSSGRFERVVDHVEDQSSVQLVLFDGQRLLVPAMPQGVVLMRASKRFLARLPA